MFAVLNKFSTSAVHSDKHLALKIRALLAINKTLEAINTVALEWYGDSSTVIGGRICKDNHAVKALKQHAKCLGLIKAYEAKRAVVTAPAGADATHS